MNRNLLEIKSKPIFGEYEITVFYGSPSADGVIEQKFAVLPGANYSAEVAHIPKNPAFDLTYTVGSVPNNVTYNVRIDWAKKRYQIYSSPGSSPLSEYPLSACINSPGKWGLKIPTPGSPVTTEPTIYCPFYVGIGPTPNVHDPNVVITDLGFGFY